MARCTLCGGKLDNTKRCTLCGLDNTKNDDMYKHLINKNDCADEPLTHVHEEPVQRKTSVRSNTQSQKNNTYGTPQYTAQMLSGKTKKATKTKASGCGAFIGTIPIIIAVLSLVFNIVGDVFESNFGAEPEPDYYEEYEYDPYEWVIDEMPEYGDEYSVPLDAGIYEVGFHIPAGTYQIDGANGTSGSVEVYDELNAIFLSEYIDDHAEMSMYDVLLFDGAYLVVYPGLKVTLMTENAQPTTVGGYLRESNEPIALSGELVAGKDFTEGSYDIYLKAKEDSYAFINIVVTPDNSDYSFYLTLDGTVGEKNFYNLPLPVGTTISVDEESLEGVEELYMIPSEITSENDLNNFYYAY